ncbi:hypothetical protein [Clostridium minihomine]|uniref:hypothetical protein n=1 Tax=Clostridium minihomine TaxID=2045012 RepID=UPI000C75BE8F|nr:hypothetical protein [Clostridium minihomine]
MSKQNTAYDFSLFEPQKKELPKRQSNVIELPAKKLEENRRPKRQPLRLLATFCFMAVLVSLVGTLVYGQVQLTELTEQVNSATKQMEEQQSVHTQLKMRSDSRLSLQATEVYAKDQLGMRKISYSQVECIKLSPGDKGQVLDKNAAGNWWSSLWNSLQNLLS